MTKRLRQSMPVISESWPPKLRWLAAHIPRPIKTWLLRRYWPFKEFMEYLVEYSIELVGHIPSHAFRLCWCRTIGGMSIGQHSSIHRRCRAYMPAQVRVGHNTVINRDILLDGRGGLDIGNNVSISEGTVILTSEHDVDSPGFNLVDAQVTIENYVFIGSCARILPGITIGEGAVVGAGAVVTRDVAPYTVVGGVPARYIRDRARNLTYQLRHRRTFG